MAEKALVAHSNDNYLGFIWIVNDFCPEFCSSTVYLYIILRETKDKTLLIKI